MGCEEEVSAGEIGAPQPQQFATSLLDACYDFNLDVEREYDIPVALGGFRFSEDGVCSEGPWRDWPGAWFYVPSFLLYQRRQNTPRAVLHLWIKPRSSVPHHVNNLSQRLRLIRRLPNVPTAALQKGTYDITLNEDQETWCSRVERAREAIGYQEFHKVVMARSISLRSHHHRSWCPLGSLRALREQHPEAISFAVRRPGAGTFLGASPEALARISGRTLTTEALAGTAPRGQGTAQDDHFTQTFLQSAKDAHEHEIVVRMFKQTLAPHCEKIDVPAAPRIRRLNQVQHLETPIRGRLRQPGGILQRIADLHPSASLGGWPRREALHWLRAHESLDRGWYGAPIGWFTTAGDGVFAVAIRSGLLRDGQATAFAGAGIVAASDPYKEWHETELKLRTLCDALRRPAAE
ncbi:MAG: isochorismate synthase [Myxococcota bacterium]